MGDVRELRVQLDRHPNVDARDAGGRTALMLATLHGQVPAVEALLAAGADPNAADAGGVTPLQAAVGANQPSHRAGVAARRGESSGSGAERLTHSGWKA